MLLRRYRRANRRTPIRRTIARRALALARSLACERSERERRGGGRDHVPLARVRESAGDRGHDHGRE